ncbi:MAG: hypothetical protein A3D92_02690 [Bacteroidetes bacterium RIFCSPHIGHO2_02_FULL_44_7]|nr:MAG: hypothetical protein A3D92_02690 [Bacteroidetes bacterium RIFCSPHIGHO2_02_FULL_44_7]
MLTLVLALAFVVQAWSYHYLHYGFYGKGILLNYCFNYTIALLFFGVLLIYKDRKPERLGYVFLIASLLKFLLFFLIIYPSLGDNHSVRSPQFFSFFIPYLVCVILEITSIIRLLNGK